MTPFPSPKEIAEMQDRARIAWAKAQEAEGLEKLRYTNAAFPYAISGGETPQLKFMWHFREHKWTAADMQGFITLIEADDVVTMLIAIGMEAARQGSFRELVEGRKRAEATTPRRGIDPFTGKDYSKDEFERATPSLDELRKSIGLKKGGKK